MQEVFWIIKLDFCERDLPLVSATFPNCSLESSWGHHWQSGCWEISPHQTSWLNAAESLFSQAVRTLWTAVPHKMKLFIDDWTSWMPEWDLLPGAPLLPPAKSPDSDNCHPLLRCFSSEVKCHIFYTEGEKLNLYLSSTKFKSVQLCLRRYFFLLFHCNSKWNRCPRSTHSCHRSKYL